MQTIVTIDFLVPIVDNFGDLGFALELALALTQQDPKIDICIWSESRELMQNMLADFTGKIRYRDLVEFDISQIQNQVCTFFGYKISGNPLYPISVLQFDYLQFGGWINSRSSVSIQSFHETTYSDWLLTYTHFVPSIASVGGGVISRTRAELSPEITDILKSSLSATVFVYPPTFKVLKPVLLAHREWQFLILGQNTGKTLTYDQNLVYLPFLPITEIGTLYEQCGLNIVRGENTLVTALLTNRTFLWDIYRENNGAHLWKMQDFIEYLGPTYSHLGEFIQSPTETLERVLSLPISVRISPTNIPDLTSQVLKWIYKPQ